jgi:hopanoid biosynthesis associated RND transporter like protein HpnN
MKIPKISDSFLNFISKVTTEYPVHVLIFCFLLVIISFFLSKNLKVDLSMIAELPEDDPMVKQFRDAYKNYGGLEYIFILLKSEDIESAKNFADYIAPMLKERKDLFKSVRHKIDIDFFKPYSLLFLDEDEINDLTDTFERHIDIYEMMIKKLDLLSFLEGAYKILDREISEREEISGEEEEAGLMKGFRKWSDILKKGIVDGKEISEREYNRVLAEVFSVRERDEEISSEYFTSKDEKMLAIMISPVESSENIAYSLKAYEFLKKVIEEGERKFPDVKAGLTGSVPIVAEQYYIIIRDLFLTNIVSMVLVVIIFGLGFGSVFYAVLMLIPLLSGLLWAFGFAYLYRGTITMTTSVFGAILTGLGIDFAAHLISRFNDEREKGATIKEAVRNSITGAGKGIITGAVTTSAAFYTLIVAYHKGVEELGIIAGTGLLLSMLAMFLIVPSILALFGGRRIFTSRIRIPPFEEKVASLVIKRPYIFLTVFVFISIFFAWSATRISFDNNFRNLMPRDMEALKVVDEFEKSFKRGTDYGLITVESIDSARDIVEKLESLTTVALVESISKFLPLNQKEKKNLLKRLKNLIAPLEPENPANVNWKCDQKDLPSYINAFERMKDMALALKQLSIAGGYFEGEDEAEKLKKNFEEIIEKLKKEGDISAISKLNKIHIREFHNAFLDLKKASSPDFLTVEKLPDDIRNTFTGKDGKFLIFAYPKQSVWTSKKFMGEFVKEIRSVKEDAFGIPVIFYFQTNRILTDLERSSIVAFICVLFLVFLDFRNIFKTAISFVPLLFGTLWMLGMMPVLNIKFNFINVGIVALIFGMGIDYGVHFLHRFLQEKNGFVAISKTGRAIFISATTTMAGFGAIMLAKFRGLNSMGEVLLVGIGMCFITAIVGMGVIFSIYEKRKR